MGGNSSVSGHREASPAGGRPVCHRFQGAVELVGGRWTGAILFKLIDGPHFFRELLGGVPGISDRLLSRRLRELEAEGLVERTVHDGPPARVSYRLSEAGRELEPALRELYRWAQEHPLDRAG